jgi:hypothetical protein
VRDPALDAWGGYERDNLFPLFVRVRATGPVHEVTLPDGQRAWLVARHAEARAALNDPRLSKDMHAALARDGAVVAEGPPGPAFARHMLSVDPPTTRDCAGWPRPRSAARAGRRAATAGPGDRRRPARRPATNRVDAAATARTGPLRLRSAASRTPAPIPNSAAPRAGAPTACRTRRVLRRCECLCACRPHR